MTTAFKPAVDRSADVGALDVTIATPFDVSANGGLETYARDLISGLADGEEAQVSVRAVGPGDRVDWAPRVARLGRFAARRWLRWIARRGAVAWGVRECEAEVGGADVVHFVGTGWQMVGFPLVEAARRRGAVATCWPAVHPGSWGDAPLDVDLYRQMDAVFVQSDFEAKHLARLGVPERLLVRCGCAAPQATPGDGDRFRHRHNLGDRPIVLFVGRKSRAKGYHALREALTQLRAEGVDATLVSIGSDAEPPYPFLEACSDLDLGSADDTTKQDALAACDLFALPSESESFGIVYLEAWAYGKPVVCGAAPASQELVRRCGGGLVTDGTPTGVSESLRSLIATPEVARSLGEQGRSAVEADYRLEKVVATHVRAWRRLRLGQGERSD